MKTIELLMVCGVSFPLRRNNVVGSYGVRLRPATNSVSWDLDEPWNERAASQFVKQRTIIGEAPVLDHEFAVTV